MRPARTGAPVLRAAASIAAGIAAVAVLVAAAVAPAAAAHERCPDAALCRRLAGNGVCDAPCKSAQCQWDGGDCTRPRTGRRDMDTSAGTTEQTQNWLACSRRDYCLPRYNDAICDAECMSPDCIMDGNDCVNVSLWGWQTVETVRQDRPALLAYMLCGTLEQALHCSAVSNNGVCNEECNLYNCWWDGGDCNEYLSVPLAQRPWSQCPISDFCRQTLSKGICEAACNTYECNWDELSCELYTEDFTLSSNWSSCLFPDECMRNYSDGICNERCNTYDCFWDGLDCSLLPPISPTDVSAIAAVVSGCALASGPVHFIDCNTTLGAQPQPAMCVNESYCSGVFDDSVCQPECWTPACAYDGDDCGWLRWPLQNGTQVQVMHQHFICLDIIIDMVPTFFVDLRRRFARVLGTLLDGIVVIQRIDVWEYTRAWIPLANGTEAMPQTVPIVIPDILPPAPNGTRVVINFYPSPETPFRNASLLMQYIGILKRHANVTVFGISAAHVLGVSDTSETVGRLASDQSAAPLWLILVTVAVGVALVVAAIVTILRTAAALRRRARRAAIAKRIVQRPLPEVALEMAELARLPEQLAAFVCDATAAPQLGAQMVLDPPSSRTERPAAVLDDSDKDTGSHSRSCSDTTHDGDVDSAGRSSTGARTGVEQVAESAWLDAEPDGACYSSMTPPHERPTEMASLAQRAAGDPSAALHAMFSDGVTFYATAMPSMEECEAAHSYPLTAASLDISGLFFNDDDSVIPHEDARPDSSTVSAESASPCAICTTAAQTQETGEGVCGTASVTYSIAECQSRLALACAKGEESVVRAMLVAGANPNLAIAEPCDATRASDCADRSTPLHLAARGGFTGICALLLHRGASPSARNAHGRTPLHEAVLATTDADPSMATLSVLLGTPGCDLNAEDRDGDTPLVLAARLSMQPGVAGQLLVAGCAAGVADARGWTPLHWAAATGNVPLLELLIAYRASVDARNLKRETPLHLAVREGHVEAVVALLGHFAQRNCEDALEVTPLDIARRQADNVMMALLSDYTIRATPMCLCEAKLASRSCAMGAGGSAASTEEHSDPNGADTSPLLPAMLSCAEYDEAPPAPSPPFPDLSFTEDFL